MKLSAFRALTRIEQTLFALPFVLGGVILAPPSRILSIAWFWVIPAFLFARVSGMAFNQLIDRHIDAQNPRTQGRALPSGRVSTKEARLIAWGSLALFVLVCFQINQVTALLAPLAALLLYVYSYMKRVHYTCHLVLGCIHFLGPVMAYAALSGVIRLPALFLGGAAAFSIIGNDIAYAIQDYAFDCSNGLNSIPACFGIKKALKISAFSHALCLLMLLAVGLSANMPLIYYGILLVVGALFVYFNWTLQQRSSYLGLEGLFFFCNVAVSFSTLLFLGIAWFASL